MDAYRPLISIIIPTYNRSQYVCRAVDSVLNQTYKDFEIILVNNGSEDNTAEIIQKYAENKKVRLFTIEQNIKHYGAFNFAIEKVRGEWFSELADDDRLEPNALEVLMNEVKRDPTITAVSFNSKDSLTGKFLGIGPTESQYLSFNDVISKIGGQFWGIIKTSLNDKNYKQSEGVPGFENIFWFRLEEKAKRYYVHKALHIFNVNEIPTITQKISSDGIKSKGLSYAKLVNETFYWKVLKEHNPKRYKGLCKRAFLFTTISGYVDAAKKYELMLKEISTDFKEKIFTNLVVNTPPTFLDKGYSFLFKVNHLLNRSIYKPHSRITN